MNNVPGGPFNVHATCAAAADGIVISLNGIRAGHPLVQEWFSGQSYNLVYQLYKPWGLLPAEDYYRLRIYFNAFSRIIFGGALNVQNCLLRFFLRYGLHEEQWHKRNSAVERLFGQSELMVPTNGVRLAVIDIYENPGLPDLAASMRHYLSVLLHEMTHAYFQLFVYRRRVESFQQDSGATGHALPWMRLTGAIETFCSQVLALPVDLRRNYALVRELVANGLPDE